jgi:dTDP-4-dehydrorhamnose 3,5-epimerase
VAYKTSSYYDSTVESGFAYHDPDVAIEWPPDLELIASPRDVGAPRLASIEPTLPFEYSSMRV